MSAECRNCGHTPYTPGRFVCSMCGFDHNVETDDHIPDVTPEVAILFGEIDLQIMEQLRSLFEDLEEFDLDDLDRSLITQHMRWVYYKGYEDGAKGVFLGDYAP